MTARAGLCMNKFAVASPFLIYILVFASSSATAQTAPTNPVLEEVTVTAQPDEVLHESDRTVYDLQNNVQAKTGSISDVLSSLPSVNVAPNGNVRVGGASVAVLIDGKPSPLLRGIGISLADALQSMPANSIAKIEVITNPGPEFRMNAAIIINLITKKPQSATFKSDLTISVGPRERRNGSLSESYGTGKWTFIGNASLRKDLRYDILDRDLIAKNPDGSMESREIEHRPTYVPYTAAFGSIVASYAATNHDTASFGGEGALNHRPRRFIDYRTLMAADGTVRSDIVTHDWADQHFDHFSVTGDYARKDLFGGDTLTLKWKHEDYDTLRDSTDLSHFITPATADSVYRQQRLERELIDTVSGDYVLSATKDRQLKAGFEVEADVNRSSHTAGSEILDANDAAHFRLDRSLFVIYASYGLSRGQWAIKGGLRGEDMATRFAQDMAPSTTLHDLQWSPNFSISRELTSDSSLSINYTRRIDRPTAYQLNPLPTVVASVTGMGNPYLKPGETQSADIGYRYSTTPITLGATVYLRRLNNQIVSYSYVSIPGDTALVSSYENAGKGTSAGFEVSATLRASAQWSISLSSDLYYVRQSAPVAGIDITNSAFTHLTKLGVAWTPDPSDSLQAQGQLRGQSLSAGGTQSGYGSLNLSYSHTFTPKLKLVINANDVLDTVHYREVIDTAQYREQSDLSVPGQAFYVGLTYKWDAAGVEK